MILIDSVYVNEGGGLVLLKYLVTTLEKLDLDVYYLFDERVHNVFSNINANRCQFIKNSNFLRSKFYKNLDQNFISKVFCFGNAPPVYNLNVPVYVYFHNPTLIETHSDMNFSTKLKCFFKQIFVNYYKKNVDIWFVQSTYMQKKLASKYFLNNSEKIKVLPFYPQLSFSNQVDRLKNSFLYVSTTYPHKNHVRLIDAFCAAYDNVKKGKLTLTVPFSDKAICELICKKVSEGYPINNLGFIKRDDLSMIYKSSEYLIFPSLAETFGLGLAEAIDGGCKVIGADLLYTYEVCQPSLTFDPFSIISIQKAIEYSILNELKSSKKIIDNDINKLIEYLS